MLGAPNQALELPIGRIAALARVSEPTVARFCKTVGFAGIKHFKLALAKSLATAAPKTGGVPFIHQAVGMNDSVADVGAKVFDSSLSTLVAVRNQLDATTLGAAVKALAAARRIEFYGVGNSGLVAIDAQHKFFRLGVPTVAYTDPHIHAQAAALLRKGDAVLAISRGGRSADLLDSARIAREQGASVVAITAAGSPLAKLAHIAVLVDAPEDPDIYTPMTSRLAQLAVVDVLSVCVALRRGAGLAPALERAKAALAKKRV
jgi:RpiR family transcriptional regulator, carbohydrate utilization regulator